MKIKIEEPDRLISVRAVQMWRASRMIGHGAGLLVLAGLIGADRLFHWWTWAGWGLYFLTALTILSAVYSIGVEPAFLQRTWRYRVSEEYVQLKHGVLTRVHVLVPMAKVEYVTTNQGPIMRRYGLYNIQIGTMASSHQIPAVPEAEAIALRDQIARLAQVKDGG
ncbi:PH domain-containing protein [Domibacillus indicus]|uniref:PH domain-containing protein n=1 Tax=Domibacillus indicus TaxID=1437523 RepID=UPI000617C1F7|nr:PH domain-containing protein [Domibacillus indicus]